MTLVPLRDYEGARSSYFDQLVGGVLNGAEQAQQFIGRREDMRMKRRRDRRDQEAHDITVDKEGYGVQGPGTPPFVPGQGPAQRPEGAMQGIVPEGPVAEADPAAAPVMGRIAKLRAAVGRALGQPEEPDRRLVRTHESTEEASQRRLFGHEDALEGVRQRGQNERLGRTIASSESEGAAERRNRMDIARLNAQVERDRINMMSSQTSESARNNLVQALAQYRQIASDFSGQFTPQEIDDAKRQIAYITQLLNGVMGAQGARQGAGTTAPVPAAPFANSGRPQPYRPNPFWQGMMDKYGIR